MFIEILTKIALSAIFYAAAIALTFTVFRTSVAGNQRSIAVIAVVMSLVNYYFRHSLESSLFPVITLIAMTVLLTIVRKYPIFYAFMLSFVTFLLYGIYETIVVFPAMNAGLTTADLLQQDITHFAIAHITITTMMILTAVVLRKLNIGFSFIVRRFSGREFLKPHNFIWCALLSVSIAVIQIIFSGSTFDPLQGAFIVGISIVFVISTIYAYRQNRKSVYARYHAFKEDATHEPPPEI